MGKSGIGSFRSALLCGCAVLAITTAAPVASARVGVTSSTTNSPLGTPPQQQQRTLQVGIDVFANERVQTAANDRAHLLFLDGSSLTVGPNSDMVIDRYVFDPAAGTGALAVTATKGIFRLVGGKITKQGEATISVGSSTIGIRGGIAIVNAPDCAPGIAPGDCQVQSYFMFGKEMTVTTPGGVELARRPGSLIASLRGGATPPAPPVIAPVGSLVGPIAQLEAPSGTGNRGPGGPQGQQIETKTAGSQLPGANVSPPGPTDFSGPLANRLTGAGSAIGPAPDIVGQIRNRLPSQPDDEEPPPPPPPPVVTISTEGRYLRDDENTSVTVSAYDVVAVRNPVNNAFIDTATLQSGVLSVAASDATFQVPWTPTGSIFAISSAEATSNLGTVSGYGFVSPNGDFYAYHLLEADNQDNSVGFFGGDLTQVAGLPTTGFGASEFFTLDGKAVFMPENVAPVVQDAAQGLTYYAYSPVLSLDAQTSNPQRSVWMQATLNISGQGEAQTSYLSIGIGNFATDETKGDSLYASGIVQGMVRESAFEGPIKYTTVTGTAETESGSSIYGPNGQYMVLVPERIDHNGENTTRTPSAGFSLPDSLEIRDIYYPVAVSKPATLPTGIGTTRTAETLHGYVGALVENNSDGWWSSYAVENIDPTDISITKLPSANRVEGQFNVSEPFGGRQLMLEWGSTSGTHAASSAYIDDRHFAMGQSPAIGSTYYAGEAGGGTIASQISMVTHSAVTDSDWLPAGVSFCECQYLTWGYWQGDLNYDSGPRAGERDFVTLGTWVAGTLSNDVDLPLSGTATYDGHIIGNVQNAAGNSYVAAGSFSHAWDFAYRQGNVAITNFDGGNYAGTTYGSPYDANFSGSFSGTNAAATDRAGSLNGSFFRSPTDAAAYQAGNFRINGIDGYTAAGTFAGQKTSFTPPPVNAQ